MTFALSVENLKKNYGKKQALTSVSFKIPKGKITGYLGPNGAGKTTTLNIMTGLLFHDGGKVLYGGAEFDPNQSAIKAKIGYVPEEHILYPNLTLDEHMFFSASLYGVEHFAAVERIHELKETFELEEYSSDIIAQLSKGNRQKAQIACALIHEPEILFLDEPMNGLDIHMQQILKKVIKEHTAGGGTLVYSSHIIEVVEKLVDHLILINKGEILFQGEPAALLESTSSADLEEAMLRVLHDER